VVNQELRERYRHDERRSASL